MPQNDFHDLLTRLLPHRDRLSRSTILSKVISKTSVKKNVIFISHLRLAPFAPSHHERATSEIRTHPNGQYAIIRTEAINVRTYFSSAFTRWYTFTLSFVDPNRYDLNPDSKAMRQFLKMVSFPNPFPFPFHLSLCQYHRVWVISSRHAAYSRNGLLNEEIVTNSHSFYISTKWTKISVISLFHSQSVEGSEGFKG